MLRNFILLALCITLAVSIPIDNEQQKIVEQLQQLGSGLQELLTTAANNLLSTVISTVDLSSLSGLLGLLGKRSVA